MPHGCGAAGATGLSVQLPPGVTHIAPAPKPGWTSTTGADATVARRAADGAALHDGPSGEFVPRARMPDAAGRTIWFGFVQECADGKAIEWTERPAEGQPMSDLKRSAWPVRILPRP